MGGWVECHQGEVTDPWNLVFVGLGLGPPLVCVLSAPTHGWHIDNNNGYNEDAGGCSDLIVSR